jgi:hypothetical protein
MARLVTGLVHGMSDADYHAHPAIGSTSAKKLIESPALFDYERDMPIDTAALRMGRLFHALALGTPHDCIVKDWDARTKEGKARAAEVEAMDVTVISQADWDTAHAMAKAVKAKVGHLLTDGEAEVAAFAEIDGIPVKAKADWLRSDGIIVDLKSTAKKPNPVGRRTWWICKDYHYHLSAAWYLDVFRAAGHDVRGFLLIFVSKTPPYLVSVGELSAEREAEGRDMGAHAREIFRDCTASGVWPEWADHHDLIHEID